MKTGQLKLFNLGSRSDSLPEMIVAPRTDPIYNAHGYLTKVPVDAILPYINRFTEPGDTVLDMFAGSGMTGIAATILDRNAVLSDISVLGQHIALGYLAKVDREIFEREAIAVMNAARKRLGKLYSTLRSSDGADVEMVRAVWTFVYLCPKCHSKLGYYDLLRENEWRSPTNCPKCGETFKKSKFKYVGDRPVQIVVKPDDGPQVEQDVKAIDLKRIKSAKLLRKTVETPSLAIEPDREMYRRSALKKWGLGNTADFFSDRNALALTFLHEAISAVKDESVRRKLLFAFTAILPRASRRYQWHPKRPLNAANQNYYIAPVYYEWNIFDLFKRKISAAIRSDEEIETRRSQHGYLKGGDVQYVRASADKLTHLRDRSVDYVFTDPPFGSNIFYSDMNLFQEAWLGDQTAQGREAVIHTEVTKKSEAKEKYAQILEGACREAYRVLKPGSHMSMVFGNSSGRVWSIVQRALRQSGFEATPIHVAILDKGQRSVKGLNSGSEGVATLDLIVTVRKPSMPLLGEAEPLKLSNIDLVVEGSLDRAGLGELPTPSHVYLVVLKEAMAAGMDLDDLHLSDVLVALRRRGFRVDEKTGRLRAVS
jgi:16S rRNA G966 N2-methylase RsmD